MPKIEISKKDFEKMVGRKFSQEELSEALAFAKAELEGIEGDTIKVEVKDSNRPDLWSAEGLARQIKPMYSKEEGIPKYKIHESDFKVLVNENLKDIRPVTACAVIKNVEITDELLKQIIQLQEKIAVTFGRQRREAAIGIYDFDKINWPINYRAYHPDKLSFIPLDYEREMTLQQILAQHPKGKEFGFLLEGKEMYPIFIDSHSFVLSMPPIINSVYSGKITEETKNLFIEVSGFDYKFVLPALDAFVAAIADRTGEIYEVHVKYKDGEMRTPILDKEISFRWWLKADEVRSLAGFELTNGQIIGLLRKARYNAKPQANNFVEVSWPSYRQDILHPVDVIEDVLVAHGYGKIEPQELKLAVTGSESSLAKFSKKIRCFLPGIGAQEIASFILTNWSVMRSWLLPSVIEFLSRNTAKEFPQRVFEVGDIVELNEKKETRTEDIRKLAFASSHPNVTFTEAKQVLDALLSALNLEYKIAEHEHSSFIPGRAGAIEIKGKRVGIIGELHPQVLENFGLEIPVAGFELDLKEIFNILQQ
jgi:phenylalanyl-tRNA synthetase beta chain